MSKHKEKTPAPLADWQVTDTSGAHGSPQAELIRQARWKRDRADWVIFRDEQGVVAAYAPPTVLSIIRKEPPVVVHPPASAPAGEKLSGKELGAAIRRASPPAGGSGQIETGRP